MPSKPAMNYPMVLKVVRSFDWEDKLKLFNELDKEIQIKDKIIHNKIYYLFDKQLANPLEISVEFDENIYLAKSKDFPLYATANTFEKAVKKLENEIEELYVELREGSDFSDEWLRYKDLLNKAIYYNEKQSI